MTLCLSVVCLKFSGIFAETLLSSDVPALLGLQSETFLDPLYYPTRATTNTGPRLCKLLLQVKTRQVLVRSGEQAATFVLEFSQQDSNQEIEQHDVSHDGQRDEVEDRPQVGSSDILRHDLIPVVPNDYDEDAKNCIAKAIKINPRGVSILKAMLIGHALHRHIVHIELHVVSV